MPRENFKETKIKKKPFNPRPQKIMKMVKQLNKQSGELKGMDTSLDLAPVISTVNTNASSFVINLIQSGNESYNRVGRKVIHKYLYIKAIANHYYQAETTTNNANSNTLRMVLVWDKQPSGNAIPTFDSIFGRTTQTGTESCSFIDPRRYDNMSRFQVLLDKVIDSNSVGDGYTGGTTNGNFQSYNINEYVKLGSRESVYASTVNPLTIADISSGALYMFFRSRDNQAYNLWNIVSSMVRLRYLD